MISERRLYVNADRSKVVPENSPQAAFLLCVAGGTVDDVEAARLGLLKAVEAAPEDKAIKSAAKKARVWPKGKG